MKKCSKCEVQKDGGSFYLFSKPAGRRAASVCIACQNIISKKYRAVQLARSPEKLEADKPKEKLCTECNSIKIAAEFGLDRAQPCGLRSACRNCMKIRKKRYYEKHPEARARDIKCFREWKKSNRIRHAGATNLSNAKHKRGKIVSMTATDVVALWESQGGRCALSGVIMTIGPATLTATSMSLDRINSAGNYSIGNVRLVCHAVNSMRGKMTDEEFYAFIEKIHEYRDSSLRALIGADSL